MSSARTIDLAKYTSVNDGVTEWYTETADLVAALVRLGWQADRYRGNLVIEQPDDDDDAQSGIAYSLLCAEVSGDSEVPAGAALKSMEAMAYAPAWVGEDRFLVSPALHAAVLAAERQA